MKKNLPWAISCHGFRTVPTNREEFVWFIAMRGKLIFARAIEIQKETWG